MYSVEGKKKYQIEQLNEQWFIDGEQFHGSIMKDAQGSYLVHLNNKTYFAQPESVSKNGKEVNFRINRTPYALSIKDHLDLLVNELGMTNSLETASDQITAPMPGLILEVAVKVGDTVEKGQILLVLEAMKMENSLKASHTAKVSEVVIQKGDSVEKNQLLIRF